LNYNEILVTTTKVCFNLKNMFSIPFWFWIALLTPVLHALTNHIDKHLLEKYLKGGEIGSLVLFSSLLAIIALPFAYFIDPTALSIPWADIIILTFNGAFLILAYIWYFYALNERDTSLVAPLFQLIPVFGFILGYIFFGETLTPLQILGSITIILGAIILSFEIHNNFKISYRVILFMTGASLVYAINAILFKFVTVSENEFWKMAFWDFAGKAILGIIIFAFISSYRKQFIEVLKTNSLPVIGLNTGNEILTTVGELALLYSILLAPVALVQVVSGFQPMFVFLFGVLFAFLIPSFTKEDLSRKALAQKIFGIVIVVLGSILINIY
jgi:drug/metabolite transporter (DMT)-like permease